MPLSQEQMSKAFAGEFLKADDLPQPKTFCILDSYMKEIGDEKELKPVIEMQTGEKLVLNQINHGVIAMLLGPDPATWNGKLIILQRQIVDFKGRPTPAIRVDANRNPNVQQQPVQQQAVQQQVTQQQAAPVQHQAQQPAPDPNQTVQQPAVGAAPAQEQQAQNMQPAQSYQDTTPPTEESELFHGEA